MSYSMWTKTRVMDDGHKTIEATTLERDSATISIRLKPRVVREQGHVYHAHTIKFKVFDKTLFQFTSKNAVGCMDEYNKIRAQMELYEVLGSSALEGMQESDEAEEVTRDFTELTIGPVWGCDGEGRENTNTIVLHVTNQQEDESGEEEASEPIYDWELKDTFTDTTLCAVKGKTVEEFAYAMEDLHALFPAFLKECPYEIP